MKTISLRADDQLLKETEQMVRHIQITRNRYINDAVQYYNNINRKKLLQQQLRKESLMLRKESLSVLHEFEKLDDGD